MSGKQRTSEQIISNFGKAKSIRPLADGLARDHPLRGAVGRLVCLYRILESIGDTLGRQDPYDWEATCPERG